jgi:hypothetical protein
MADPVKIRPREKVKSQWGDIIDFLGPFSGDINIFKGMEELTGADEATKRIHETDPERKISPFEYAPFYSGLGDWNLRPEVTKETEEFYATGKRKKPKEGYEPGRVGFTNTPQAKAYQEGIKQRDKIEEERKKYEEEMAKAKKKAEAEAAFLDSPKGRLQTLWADADKRDAILGGITDAMTEVKFGEDAYQSRFHDTQKKVRQNLKVAEATKIARQKAQLDMMKVAAETSALANPAQYMTTSQKDAMAIVTASGLRPGTPEWNQEYSRQLQQIVVKDLTSAKASALTPLYTYSQVLLASDDPQDQLTGQTMVKAIESIAGYLSGTGTGGKSQNINEIVVEEKETKTGT